MTNRARQPKQILGLQHHSEVKSGFVVVMVSPDQTGAVNMVATTRKLAGIMGRLQCKTAAYSN
jgi:hypothetical protein